MIEFITIGFTLDEALTGYDIKKNIETRTGLFYKASYGSIYPTLRRLTERGLVDLREDTQTARTKKYYRATEQGRTAFFEWLASPLLFTDEANTHVFSK